MSTKITAEMVNNLRKRTSAGFADCKKALVETNGDIEEAITLLKKKGVATAAKKAGRDVSEGIVQSYIHLGGKVGVLIEVNCETDFVAKNDDFKQFVRDLCMHTTAASPLYVSRENVPEKLVSKERDIAMAQAEGKPKAAMENIVKGKLNKWYSQICLLEQSYVKNQDQKVQDVVTEMVSKLGENIVVQRFVRYQLGE